MAETLGFGSRGIGSFAGMRFSPVPGPELDRNEVVERERSRDGDVVRAAKLASRDRAEDSMMSFNHKGVL